MKAGPLLGEAAGLGCDEAGAQHVLGVHLVPTDAQGIDGAVDRLGARTLPCPSPSPNRTIRGKRVDDPKAEMGRFGDQQPAIIGAEIESRVAAPGLAPLAPLRQTPPASDQRKSRSDPDTGFDRASSAPAIASYFVKT